MARPGDVVLVTKGCAVEATAIAGHLIPQRLRSQIGAGGVERARALVDHVSVVADCRVLLELGAGPAADGRSVTALHDATEGGVLGGLLELAQACGHDVSVERARIPLTVEARGACAALGGIDPYWTLAEGALIATVPPGSVIDALTVESATVRWRHTDGQATLVAAISSATKPSVSPSRTSMRGPTHTRRVSGSAGASP